MDLIGGGGRRRNINCGAVPEDSNEVRKMYGDSAEDTAAKFKPCTYMSVGSCPTGKMCRTTDAGSRTTATCVDIWASISADVMEFLNPYVEKAAGAVPVAKGAQLNTELSLSVAEAALETAGETLEGARADQEQAETTLSATQAAWTNSAIHLGRTKELLHASKALQATWNL